MELQDRNEPRTSGGSRPPVDAIQRITGTKMGRFQVYICFLMFLCKFFIAFHQLAILFLTPKLTYTCGNSDVKNTCPCSNPVYDKSIFKNTITMEWNLICDKETYGFLVSQTIFQAGTLFGSVLFGMASDRFGRKYPLAFAALLQVIFGTIAAFAGSYWLFQFLRFMVGLSVGGTMVISFVIIMEFVAIQYRDVISALYQVPFNLGHCLLPVISYFTRDWSKYQLCISVPGLILLVYFCLVPETPRWLIAMKKTDKAVAVLERVARMNKLPTANIKSEVQAYQSVLEKSQVKKGTIVDLFRHPNMRKNLLVMSFNWLTCSYCFYGVGQYMGQLGGNVFVNVAASAAVTTLGTLGSIPLMKLLGRKTILLICNAICGVCLLVVAFVPEGPAKVAFAIIGLVASFVVFVVVYLYTSELFPTVVRSAATGFSSSMARVGSMVAPFVIFLKVYYKWLPPIVFAILPLIAVLITLLLPETKGRELMTTIAEGEAFGKKPPKTK